LLMTKYHDRLKLLYDTGVKKYIVTGLPVSSTEMDWRFRLKPRTGSIEINSFLSVTIRNGEFWP
jgi:hypothetical protein